MIAEPESTAKQRSRRGKHPNSLANLNKTKSRFKKGQSGNPAGAPITRLHLWKHIKDYAQLSTRELQAIKQDKLSISQITARNYVLAMMQGDWLRVKEALDRDDGRPTDRVEIEQETRIIIERI